jgi:hypothetical protein
MRNGGGKAKLVVVPSTATAVTSIFSPFYRLSFHKPGLDFVLEACYILSSGKYI